MANPISNLWKKFKLALAKALTQGEAFEVKEKQLENGTTPVETANQESTGAEVSRTPGLKCPECTTLITISIPMLLSGTPVTCPNCLLKLSIDQDQSKHCIDALRKLDHGIKEAEAVQREAGNN